MLLAFSFAGVVVIMVVVGKSRASVESTGRHACHSDCHCGVEYINELEHSGCSDNNAYSHRNAAVIQSHHDQGLVPQQYVVIAAEVLGIAVHQVNVGS
jgi:hypothetical protein